MTNRTRSLLIVGTLAATGAATAVRAAPIAQFSFEDATGTSTVDSVNGVSLDMKDGSGALTDYHGAAGSGVAGVGRALDFSSNAGHYNSTTTTAVAGPVAVATNNAALGLGTGVTQLAATIWIKSDTLLPANKAPRYFVFGPNGTTDVNAPSSGANVFGLQNQNNDITVASVAHQNQTAVFVGGTNFTITTGPSIANSTWTFFAVTYDSTVANGTISLYRGDETTAPTLVGTAVANKGSLDIGSTGTLMLGDNDLSSHNRAFDGWIDDFRLMTGALDAGGVQAIWAQSAPEPGSLAVLAPALTAVLATRRGRRIS